MTIQQTAKCKIWHLHIHCQVKRLLTQDDSQDHVTFCDGTDSCRSQKVWHIKADSHIACHTHAIPLPCRATKGLECVFPIWFTQCSRVWLTLAMPHPCRSSQGHSTARPLRDGLWATCSRSASSGYHMEFHEVIIRCIPISDAGGQCETKHYLHGRGKEW
jgi:hypothetical protein